MHQCMRACGTSIWKYLSWIRLRQGNRYSKVLYSPRLCAIGVGFCTVRVLSLKGSNQGGSAVSCQHAILREAISKKSDLCSTCFCKEIPKIPQPFRAVVTAQHASSLCRGQMRLCDGQWYMQRRRSAVGTQWQPKPFALHQLHHPAAHLQSVAECLLSICTELPSAETVQILPQI